MKKFLFAVICLATLGLTSCSDNSAKCYEFTVTISGASAVTYHYYVTKTEADAQKLLFEAGGATCTYKAVDTAESECTSL